MRSARFTQMLKIRGRGHSKNHPGRFAHTISEFDGNEQQHEHESRIVLTELSQTNAKSILSNNHSPDVPFERSLNIYRGCEHGCVYCFARPTHSYLDLSPGLDFEQKLFFKTNAPELLKKEFLKENYVVKTISLGNITDTYQPIEKRLGLTRKILQLMQEYQHPVSLVTKSSLIERDIDILEKLAQQNLVHIAITITTLDSTLARKLEPRAATPERRLQTIKTLADAGVPTSILIAPIIPVLTDAELESILTLSQQAGCEGANFVILRLPHELKTLFVEWLAENFPLKAEHILNRVKEMHGVGLYQSQYGKRMRGSGEYAKMLENRFRIACKKLGLKRHVHGLDESKFLRSSNTEQMQLF
jgi:DNA repair photolyase